MKFKFDMYKRMEEPQLILCELSKEPLCILYLKGSPVFKLNFNDISTVTFDVPMIINDEKYIYYELVKDLRFIHVPTFGYFQIIEIMEHSDGLSTYKSCTAVSAQAMLQTKKITDVKGEYKLWNALSPHESLLGVLLTLAPEWSIGNVDAVFVTRQRSVDVTDSDLYSIMTNDIYESYEAILIFDYENFVIDIYDANKVFPDSGIVLTFENLLKATTVSPQTDGIITALRVLGGDGLDISGVNPTGDTLYNVDFFMDRMTPGLRAAYEAYKQKYNGLIAQYSSLLVQYKNKNAEIEILENKAPEYKVNFTANADGTAVVQPPLISDSGLYQLQALRQALDNVKSVRISKGNIPYSDVNAIMSQVDVMMAAKNTLITNARNQANAIRIAIEDINTQLKMENNFTGEQWVELNRYFRYDTLQDNGYIITDIMTQEEKQQIREELLEYGKLVLSKSCVPKFLFEISCVNFLALLEYAAWTNKFELGQTFTLKINDDYIVHPLLLGVHINFNDLSDFKLIYGNQTKINDGFDFSAYAKNANASANVSFDLVKLEAMKKQADDVTRFINGSLDLALNNLVTNQSRVGITMDELGLRIREYDPDDGRLLPQELWITGKQLVFSKDNFLTAELALGEIEAPGSLGGKVYGLIAPAIVGRLIAGNELHISNQNNNFLLNENGAFLNNASFTITKGNNTIKLDPTNGFTIWNGLPVSDANRQIYLGTDGNVYFRGNIYGGSININNRARIDSNGNAYFSYAEISGGAIRLGGLTVTPEYLQSLGRSNFSNAILDNSCQYHGAINGGQINQGSITANQIQAGTITANLIAAGAIAAGKIATNAISASNIQAGAITGDKITVDNAFINKLQVDMLKVKRLVYDFNNPNSYAAFQSHSDFVIYSNGTRIFQVYNAYDGISLYSMYGSFIGVGVQGSFPKGTWNFSAANVVGINASNITLSSGSNLQTRLQDIVSALQNAGIPIALN